MYIRNYISSLTYQFSSLFFQNQQKRPIPFLNQSEMDSTPNYMCISSSRHSSPNPPPASCPPRASAPCTTTSLLALESPSPDKALLALRICLNILIKQIRHARRRWLRSDPAATSSKLFIQVVLFDIVVCAWKNSSHSPYILRAMTTRSYHTSFSTITSSCDHVRPKLHTFPTPTSALSLSLSYYWFFFFMESGS